jgi:hypothetical protein
MREIREMVRRDYRRKAWISSFFHLTSLALEKPGDHVQEYPNPVEEIYRTRWE